MTRRAVALARSDELRRRARHDRAGQPRWMAGMQSANGGWGAFDVDNDAEWLYKMPFCDFGETVTRSALRRRDRPRRRAPRARGCYEDAVRRGLEYLLAEQEEDGSWFGRWGVNHVYGTAAVLPALEAAGFATDHPAMRRAVAWLEAHQNEDGGFGEDCRVLRPRRRRHCLARAG